jgi:hypothetical protein
MRMLGRIALAAAMLFATADAQAQTRANITRPTPGFTYFNRPGATLQQHQHDIEFCFEHTLLMEPPGSPNSLSATGPNNAYYVPTYVPTNGQSSMSAPAAGAALGATAILVIAAADMQYLAEQAATRTNLDNCMVVLGWRVVRVEDQAGARLSHLGRAELAAQLAPFVGAELAQSAVARTFSNDLIDPSTALAPPPGGSNPVSLSLLALPDDSLAARFRTQDALTISYLNARDQATREARHREIQYLETLPHRVDVERQNALKHAGAAPRQVRPLDAAALASLPSGSTLIVVRVAGSHQGDALAFDRVDADGRRLETIVANVSDTKNPAQMAFAVTEGRWVLGGVSNGIVSMSLCMGAPAFDIGEGEAVFAGSFDFGGASIAPDMTLGPATTMLAAQPNVASRIRPAAYKNGVTAECRRTSLFYALEFPGAPFLDSYHWGDAGAAAASPTPAASAGPASSPASATSNPPTSTSDATSRTSASPSAAAPGMAVAQPHE